MIDLGEILHKYLVKLEGEREREEGVFHASGAGSCYRKQLYSYYNYPQDEKDMQSYRILDLGTIVHKRFQDSVEDYINLDGSGITLFSEDDINIASLNLVGRYDVGALSQDNEFYLWDIKTAAAYKWTTKFGLKKNRKPMADTNYKLQLGTYAMGIKQKYKPDKLHMYLYWYNKNTSQVREQLVAPEWEEKAYEYWADVNDILNTYNENFESAEVLMPGISQGVPFQDWECKYCQFHSICPTTINK
jgi:CRISPR/Cas system-associated exonuclease Cas4 (RecB family)